MRSLFLSFIFLAAAFFHSEPVKAAGPVTHAYLAECWLDKTGIKDASQRQEFLLGTLFPAISHIGVSAGDAMHFEGVTSQDVCDEENFFIAGMLFHSLVDDCRKDFIRTTEIFDIFEGLPEEHRGLLLKFLEDEATFSMYDWTELRKGLKNVSESEKQFDIPVEVVEYWHKVLEYCFSYKSSQLLHFMSDKGFQDVPAETIRAWKKSFSKLYQSREVRQYTADMLQCLQQELSL